MKKKIMQKKSPPKNYSKQKPKNTYYNIKASQDNQKNPPRKKTKTKQQSHIHLV